MSILCRGDFVVVATWDGAHAFVYEDSVTAVMKQQVIIDYFMRNRDHITDYQYPVITYEFKDWNVCKEMNDLHYYTDLPWRLLRLAFSQKHWYTRTLYDEELVNWKISKLGKDRSISNDYMPESLKSDEEKAESKEADVSATPEELETEMEAVVETDEEPDDTIEQAGSIDDADTSVSEDVPEEPDDTSFEMLDDAEMPEEDTEALEGDGAEDTDEAEDAEEADEASDIENDYFGDSDESDMIGEFDTSSLEDAGDDEDGEEENDEDDSDEE